MTENEAIKVINDKYETFFALSTTNVFDIAMATAIKALEEIKQYRAIGTIEEFKALKEKEERFDRNIRMFNEIGLEIRAKAIDEFAHQLKENLNQEFPRNYESTRPYFSLENARLLVDDIAEQMKAGGIDG